MTQLIISYHAGCIDKTNPDRVAEGWSNIEADPNWLVDWIKRGYGWCATHFRDDHRSKDNATTSNVVVFDVDGHYSLDDWWSHPDVQQWCLLTYTSASHSANNPRFRALFLLAKPTGSLAKHQAVYDDLSNRLFGDGSVLKGKELTQETFDHCGRNSSCLWYGNRKAQVRFNDNRDLTGVPGWFVDAAVVVEKTVSSPITPADDLDIARACWGLSQCPPTEDGQYNSHYLPVTSACAAIGPAVEEAWSEWVLRGHHGLKRVNANAEVKWKGFTTDGGVGWLFFLFENDGTKINPKTGEPYPSLIPGWKDRLPTNLKFNAKPSRSSTAEWVVSEKQTSRASQKTVQKKSGRLSLGDQKAIVQEAFPIIRQNVMTTYIEVVDEKGNIEELEGDKLNNIYLDIYKRIGIELNKTVAADLVNWLAMHNLYNPVIEYLESVEHLPAHPHWDNLGPWLLGNHSPIANDALQRIMIAAVARSYQPGCSMSWLPILVGPQGAGKSMLVKSLMPEEFVAEINAPIEKLENEPSLLHRGTLLELGEIDHYFKSSTVESFKNIISTSVDQVRLPYARKPQRMPRRFVMFGTTNRSQFLVDPTGNRRFVPLEIPIGFEVPWKLVKQERDQLWSAALAAYRAGAEHEYRTGEIAKMRDYIQQFNDDDVWMQDITSYLKTVSETTTRDVLKVGLNVDIHKTSNKESRRVNDILTRLGWRRQQTTRDGRSTRIWIRPEGDPGPDESHIKDDF